MQHIPRPILEKFLHKIREGVTYFQAHSHCF